MFSIILGIISIFGIIYQNYKLAHIYNNSDGKTKALFGIIELAQIDLKIYLGIISILGIILGVFAIRRNENKIYFTTAILLNVIGFILLFIRFWRNLI